MSVASVFFLMLKTLRTSGVSKQTPCGIPHRTVQSFVSQNELIGGFPHIRVAGSSKKTVFEKSDYSVAVFNKQ